MKADPDNATVTLGDGVAVIRRRGVTDPIVAKVLGTEHDEDGNPRRVWLDRLVHRPEQVNLGLWSVEGAYVSMLTLSSP
jgi:hypothetical protein